MRLKLWMFSLVLIATAIGWACQSESKEDSPEPVAASQSPKPRGYDGPQLSGGGGGNPPTTQIRISFNKFSTNCHGGFGFCIKLEPYDPPTPRLVTLSVFETTNILRLKINDGYSNPVNETFEIGDPDAFQGYAADLGYSQIEVIPDDYIPVYYPGTTIVDYVDIAISTLN